MSFGAYFLFRAYALAEIVAVNKWSFARTIIRRTDALAGFGVEYKRSEATESVCALTLACARIKTVGKFA